MPDYATINRIAQMLAGATSSEPAEAQVKLHGAYKRMVRDKVSIKDLLTLPKTALFQSTLVKLVDLILSEQHDLSPVGKREAYEHYMLLIVAKFSGGWDSQSGAGQDSRQEDDREAAAREYERRRKAEEDARKAAGGQPHGSHRAEEKSSGDSEKPFKWENSKTPKSYNSYKFKLCKHNFSFSPAGFFSAIQILFGRGSITWHALRQPGSAFRLFAASVLWGMGFSGVMLIVAGLFHALTNTGPLWDITLKNAFSFLAAIGTIWKARAFYLAGWFR